MSILIDGTSGITPLAFSSNLQFTSTGQRILGDFSNATIANRVMFQTSTANSTTNVGIIPNGTSVTTALSLFASSSDLANTSLFQFVGNSSENRIIASRTGTGTYLPMTFFTSGSERMRIDTSGNVGIGTSSPQAKLNVKGTTGAYAFFDGTSQRIVVGDVSGVPYIQAMNLAGSNSGLAFYNYSAEAMRIDSNGNVGVGTGSPIAKLDVIGSINFGPSDGSCIAVGTTNTFTPSSGNPTAYYGMTFGGFITNSISLSGYNGIAMYTGAGAERMRIDSSGRVQVSTNNFMPWQGDITSKSTTATLTGAELVTGILNTTGTSYTVTLPSGTDIEGALSWSANNVCLDWFVINTASGTITIGANSNTTLGALTVATATSAQFRIRRTAANTFTVYRLR